MRVVLTGATGLIGRQTARVLAREGHEVTAVSRSGDPVEGAAHALALDLLDPTATREAMEQAKPDALVHLAWYGGPNRMGARANLDWAAATLTLASAFAGAGGRRFVGAGSCAEYDWSKDHAHSESDTANPQSIYGHAKAQTGALLTGAAGALGIDVAWARIFFVYGPGEPEGRLIGDLLRGVREGRTVPCTDGEQVRDFLHSEDVAGALSALLASGTTGTVNVASGTGTRVRDLIEAIAVATARPDLAEYGAIERPPQDPARIVADASKLTSKVGFIPRFDIASGVADLVRHDIGGSRG